MKTIPGKAELHGSRFMIPNGSLFVSQSSNGDSCNSSFRGGYSLIEMLVYISVLATLLGVGYTAIYRAMDNSIALRRNAEDITRAIRVGEIWRADMRDLGRTAHLETVSNGSILHLRKAGREVSYRFADHTVCRRIGTGQWTPLLHNVKSCEFFSETRSVQVWRWELELLPQRKKLNHVRPLFTFIAAPATNPQ